MYVTLALTISMTSSNPSSVRGAYTKTYSEGNGAGPNRPQAPSYLDKTPDSQRSNRTVQTESGDRQARHTVSRLQQNMHGSVLHAVYMRELALEELSRAWYSVRDEGAVGVRFEVRRS